MAQKRDPWADVIDFDNSPDAQSGPPRFTPVPDDYSNAIDFAPAPQPSAPQASPATPTLNGAGGSAEGIAAPKDVVFGDEDHRAGRPHLSLTPEQEAQVFHILSTAPLNEAAARARSYLHSQGWPGAQGDNFDNVIAARRATGKVNEQFAYAKPQYTPSATGAAAEGTAEGASVGGAPKLYGLLDAGSKALGLGGSGDPTDYGSFGNNYNAYLDHYEGQRSADVGEHPYIYGGGQILGSLLLPTGAAGAADRTAMLAEKEALASGATAEEAKVIARVAARRVFSNRAALEGSGYGAAGGALGSDSPQEAAKNGLIGAGLGGILGKGLGEASRLVGPKSTTADTVDYGALADRLGIQPTPATIGGAPSEIAQMGLATLPGSGSAVASASEREVQGLGDAARRAAESFGTPGTPQSTGEALVNGVGDYRSASRTKAGELYDQRDQAFNGPQAPVVLRNTASVGQQFARDFPTSDVFRKLSEHPIVSKILGGVPQDGEITLNEATDALSQVRATVRNLQGSDKGPILNRATQLESALAKDVYESAGAADQAAGRDPALPGSATYAQKTADQYYAQRARALKGPLGRAVKSLDDPTTTSPESVYNQLASDTAIKGGNNERLRQTWFRLPDEAKGKFAATMIDDMGRPQPSARTLGNKIFDYVTGGGDEAALSDGFSWSPSTFMTSFNKMSPAARRVVFGKEGEQQLVDIAQYASRLNQLGKTRNFSNTAKNLAAAGIVGAVGQALLGGHVAQAGMEVAAPVASYATARVFLGIPAMRAWTKDVLKVGLASPKTQAAAQKPLITRLAVIAKANPAMAPEIRGLQQYLTDTISSAVPLRAAANQDGQEPGISNGQGAQNQPQSEGAQP
jgi:hypothetical protein